MKKNGIAVIGRVAEGTVLLDGQTVKTKILYEELKKEFSDRKVVCVDVYQYKKRFLSVIFKIIQVFFSCDHIFVLLSRNGRTFLFPFLTGMNAVFRRRMYHDVIGGALPGEAEKSAFLRRQLNRFDVNWVEFPLMKERLIRAGVTNAEVLPNFKRLSILDEKEIEKINKKACEPFVFTMFSRVIKEKGIGAAAEAVAGINSRFERIRAVLYIYGPVEPCYKEEFEQVLNKYKDCVYYKGCISYDQSVQILKDGYMLLFPSVYRGEGMPGTIIDAFSAGQPVIATNWHFNSLLVRNGETGFCYDWRQPEKLYEMILYAVENPEIINDMRKKCLEEAMKYTPESAMMQIRRRMDGED